MRSAGENDGFERMFINGLRLPVEWPRNDLQQPTACPVYATTFKVNKCVIYPNNKSL